MRMDDIYIDDDVYVENSLKREGVARIVRIRECRTFGRSVCRRMYMYVSSEERKDKIIKT